MKHYVQDLCSFKLHISGDVNFVGIGQVSQPIGKVVEHNTNPVDLHPGFNERYHNHELFRHISEATLLQPNALD
jgi:hypothetical protein